MKKVIRLIGMFLTVVKVSASTIPMDQDPYLSDNIVSSVKNISISKLLDFKTIASAIHDEFDKSRFYYIIAYEIDTRLQKLDGKFYSREKDYHRIIKRYEDELDLLPYKYTDESPQFNYTYQSTDINDEDDHCLNPGLFLKKCIKASGLLILPKTGHTINLEEPSYFNNFLSDFFSQVEHNKWLPRDPRSNSDEIMKI